MRPFATVFIDDWAAFSVDAGDVIPPELLGASSLHFLEKAYLANVFRDYFLATNHLICRLHGAIPASAEAISVDILGVTKRAVPENVMRGECYIFTERLLYLLEILKKIHSAIRAGSHPKVPINFSAVLKRWDKLSHQDYLLFFFFFCWFVPIKKLLAIGSRDKHWWDTNSATSAVVTHIYIYDILIEIVDHNSHCNSDVLHVSNFLNKSALTTPSHIKRGYIIAALKLIFIIQWELFAALFIIRVEVNLSHDCLAIRYVTEIGVTSDNGAV